MFFDFCIRLDIKLWVSSFTLVLLCYTLVLLCFTLVLLCFTLVLLSLILVLDWILIYGCLVLLKFYFVLLIVYGSKCSYHKKTLIKSPKIYIRDSGLIHCLLGIESYNDLLGHPILGTSYESFIIESLLQKYSRYTPSFYRSSSGAEIDLVLEKGNHKIAIEIKSSSCPKLSQGFFEAQKIIQPDKSFVIAPIKEAYPLKNDIWVYNLAQAMALEE